jgi:hypothetical protein
MGGYAEYTLGISYSECVVVQPLWFHPFSNTNFLPDSIKNHNTNGYTNGYTNSYTNTDFIKNIHTNPLSNHNTNTIAYCYTNNFALQLSFNLYL